MQKKTGRPYKVQEMSFKDFFDLKKLNEIIGNIDGRSNDEDSKISNMRIIKIEKEDPFKILYKMSYAQEDYNVVNIKKT